jgi:hypothetical protein
MNRMQMACLSLIASAFVLAGLLAVQVSQPTARGEMVIDRENFALMTTQTRPDEEALFVLDNSSGSLLIYRMNISRDQLELLRLVNLRQRMGLGGG